jgi:hypothetical protein
MMVNNSGNKSYRNWAIKISILIKDRVSKQAIWKKMHERQIVFLKEVLSYIIKEKIGQKRKTKLKKFRNVIIEDSTHIQLNDKLHESYPGNANWQIEKKKAILKIQSCYNLTKRMFIRFDITSFRDNDQGYSQKILEVVKKGDLIIRDLGYFVLKTFKRLDIKRSILHKQDAQGGKLIIEKRRASNRFGENVEKARRFGYRSICRAERKTTPSDNSLAT